MKNQSLLKDITNSIPSAALCIDKHLKIISTNPEFDELFGAKNLTEHSTIITQLLFFGQYTESLDKHTKQITLSQFINDSHNEQLYLLDHSNNLIKVKCLFKAIKLEALKDYYLLSFEIAQNNTDNNIFAIYKSVFNKLDLGLFISNFNTDEKGTHGYFIEVNDLACKQLGYSRRELLKLNARTLNPNSNNEAIKAVGRNIKRDGEANFNAIHVGKDGTGHSVSVNAKLLFINDDAYVLSICRYNNKKQQQIENDQIRFGRLMDLSWDELYVFNTEDLKISRANTGALDNLGYSKQEISELKITDLIQDISENTFQRLTKSLNDGKKSQVVLESIFKRKDNTTYPIEIRIQISHTESPPIYLANVQNISERKQTEINLLFLANHDPLTGLYNRNKFISKLNESMEYCKRSDSLMAVIFLDLDGFKHINDTLGHDMGDCLIKETAKRLLSSIRSTDIASRMGGDEFTAILTNLHHTDDIIFIANKIVKNIAKPFKISGHEIRTSCSLGITVYPFTDTDNSYTLIKQADTAMYQAKSSGKNRFAFYAATLAKAQINLKKLEDDLKKGFENNEFEVYYQTKVNLRNNKIYGGEALLRWKNSTHNNMSPADFIPIMEKINLIQKVDLWVLEETCRHLKDWLKVAPDLIISINLSAKHFARKNLVSDIKNIIMRHDISAKNLEIEITEGVLISKTKHAEAVLNKLKSLGFNISLDDFGSGYSSLSYLKQLPINRLKIDKAFVYDLENNKDSRAIIEAIISLANSLELSIIAEGIETNEQANILRNLQCFEGQGYLFSKPCPAKEFIQLISDDYS